MTWLSVASLMADQFNRRRPSATVSGSRSVEQWVEVITLSCISAHRPFTQQLRCWMTLSGSYDVMIGEQRIGQDVEGSGRGLF